MIRTATVDDVPVIHTMIRELAEYERARESAKATEAQLREALFGAHPAAFVLIAEDAEGPVGFACGSGTSRRGRARTVSIWRISTSVRRRAAAATARRSSRARGDLHGARLRAFRVVSPGLERTVHRFLPVDRAEPMDGWTVFRLTGDALHNLAGVSNVNAA